MMGLPETRRIGPPGPPPEAAASHADPEPDQHQD